jgi:hypothetical protein
MLLLCVFCVCEAYEPIIGIITRKYKRIRGNIEKKYLKDRAKYKLRKHSNDAFQKINIFNILKKE